MNGGHEEICAVTPVAKAGKVGDRADTFLHCSGEGGEEHVDGDYDAEEGEEGDGKDVGCYEAVLRVEGCVYAEVVVDLGGEAGDFGVELIFGLEWCVVVEGRSDV